MDGEKEAYKTALLSACKALKELEGMAHDMHESAEIIASMGNVSSMDGAISKIEKASNECLKHLREASKHAYAIEMMGGNE